MQQIFNDMDLCDALIRHLGPYGITRLALCNKKSAEKCRSEADRYADFRVYSCAIKLLFVQEWRTRCQAMLELRVFRPLHADEKRVFEFNPNPFRDFENLLPLVVSQAKEKHASFQVALVFIQCKGPKWTSRFRVYCAIARASYPT